MELKFLLKRKKLLLKHQNILSYPLTIGIASMGFGKTIAARHFLESNEVNHIWISIESKESSKEYIWDLITKQISEPVPDLGNQLRTLGFPQSVGVRDKIIDIIEDSAYLKETVIVFDDFHNLNSLELDNLIERLVRRKIKGLHIFILTRTVPNFNIQELELKGYCYRISSINYELSKDEVKEYFSQNKVKLNSKEIDLIYKISEGWITAVYLLFENYKKTGLIEYRQDIEKLIETTVMKRYESSEVETLRVLSILDKFTAEQAKYILGNDSIDNLLYNLSLENAFIRFDVHEKTFRFHNIFRNYLEKNTFLKSKSNYIKYIKRIGKWYINNNDVITGIKYFLKIGEYDLVLKEFEKKRINIIFDNNKDFVINTFKEIPEDFKNNHPIAHLAYIGFYTTNIDSKEGLNLLDKFEKKLNLYESFNSKERKQIEGEIELIKAYAEFNNPWKMRKSLKAANELLEQGSLIADDKKIITFGSPHGLYLYYCEKGSLKSIMECVVEMFCYYTEVASGCGKGFDDLVRGEYYLETGNLEESSIYSYKSLYKAENLDQEEVVISAKFNLARTKILEGKFKNAENILEELKQESNNCSTAILVSTYDLVISYINGLLGRYDIFPDWIKNGEMEISQILYQVMGYNYILYGKYLLNEKEYIKLDVLCDDLDEIFRASGNIIGKIHTNIFRAVSFRNLYKSEKALEYIDKALELGESDGLTTIFVEYGDSVIDILKLMEEKYKNRDYIKNIISGTENYIENLEQYKSVKKYVEKITSREKEVLELIVKGYTNKEIAEELYIAEVTVRKNITSIYRKLKVNGRASAVRKSMNLDLV
jgi:LuxR family maltose regulon positive regulatory protein